MLWTEQTTHQALIYEWGSRLVEEGSYCHLLLRACKGVGFGQPLSELLKLYCLPHGGPDSEKDDSQTSLKVLLEAHTSERPAFIPCHFCPTINFLFKQVGAALKMITMLSDMYQHTTTCCSCQTDPAPNTRHWGYAELI